tara:strand:+ start:10082 stop:10693 length:612 start_codon:yes stop_codon:yes gene_type:complete
MEKRKPDHYVDNKEFLEHMIAYRECVISAEENGDPTPQIPDEIGSIFWKIASHLSYKSNFINYGFRDDMISDGIENCVQYIKNFDPEKSKNPFSYFTQIIYFAFLRRIQKEKKQLYVRYKSLENANIMDSLNSSNEDYTKMSSVGFTKLYDNMSEFIQSYEDAIEKKKAIKAQSNTTARKSVKKNKSNNILQFAANLSEEEKV